MASETCLRFVTCPVCAGALCRESGTLRCARGHSFDIAREGYVNLLAGRRLSPSVGDTRAMLLARRRFLVRGHYSPLARALISLVGAHLSGTGRRGGGPALVLDAGCGEGWYLATLAARMENLTGGAPVCCIGTDVSKEAARLAAQRHCRPLFLVADTTRRLPLADGCADVLLNVLAPRNPAEFARVMRPGGLLLSVTPRPGHLAELRAALPLIGIEPDKQQRLAGRLTGPFAPAGEQHLDFPLRLDGESLRDLLTMTPSYRHLPPRTWATVRTMDRARATASFALLSFRRRD